MADGKGGGENAGETRCTCRTDHEECDSDMGYEECVSCGFQFCEFCEMPECVSCTHHRLEQFRCPKCNINFPCVKIGEYVHCRSEFEVGIISGDIVYCRTCRDFVETGDNECAGHDLCSDRTENEALAQTLEKVLIPNKLVHFKEEG